MTLRTAIATTLILATAACEQPSAEESRNIPAPKLPATGAGPTDFVPRGWKILGQAKGDLNGDKKQDAVLVLGRADEADMPPGEEELPRLLVVLIKTSAGLRRAASSTNAILCFQCGGVLGDPFQSVEIQRGTFVINHYGGSRWRWSYTHRFRFQDGDWFLIGRTETADDIHTKESSRTDENLLTGDVIEENTDQKGREKRKKYRKKRAPLIPLSRHSIGQ